MACCEIAIQTKKCVSFSVKTHTLRKLTCIRNGCTYPPASRVTSIASAHFATLQRMIFILKLCMAIVVWMKY